MRKTPARCAGLSDVRYEVNRIDAAVIRLLGERQRYALAATAFKPDLDSIRSPDHLPAFFADRAALAARAGLEPALVARIFREITAASVRLQSAAWRTARKRRRDL